MALIALVVAAIGAGAGFAGGYLSARWQARSNLEQWRRDKLLGFCSDLVAATAELTQFSNWNKPFPEEKAQRMRITQKCVLLLSEELSTPLDALASTALDLAQKLSQDAGPIIRADTARLAVQVQQREKEFVDAARDLLLNVPQSPTPWRQFWSRISGTPSAEGTDRGHRTAPAETPAGHTPGGTSAG
jgi:hypothetical protein